MSLPTKFYIFVSIILQLVFISFCIYIDIDKLLAAQIHRVFLTADGASGYIRGVLVVISTIFIGELLNIKVSFWCWAVVPVIWVFLYVFLFYKFLSQQISDFKYSQLFKRIATLLTVKKPFVINDIKINKKVQSCEPTNHFEVDSKPTGAKPIKKKLTVNKSAL